MGVIFIYAKNIVRTISYTALTHYVKNRFIFGMLNN